ncbi:DUF2891 domain-containing protein [Sphingobacterium sp. DR205]|uniref:DUF2891 domain-containing protein n=1 Tax=Sphingobacterium sp. DR205 TaxID=2713573 RepID=UPI0013E45887|nr:DUF2891 domain-containing protein [Sphingobacterium sp. DR205]QIH34339.1 DUF2891 domain-containing protein [Sphingobacterium sp. DR205]
MKRIIGLICSSVLAISCHNNAEIKVNNSTNNAPIQLDSAQAKHLLTLPLHCIEIEYPNKLGQVLGSDQDLKGPRTLHPIFYGCFDWHSSVHGYWSIVRILKQFPDLDKSGVIRKQLNRNITAENAATELAFFQDKNNKNFERTYGWAWLLQLQKELLTWKDPDAERWAKILDPMVKHIMKAYQEYLPKLVYPIRTGYHDNSAFGLSLALDFARGTNQVAFEKSLMTNAVRLYSHDKNCNISFEPSGSDFLSPCLEEALCMSAVLRQDEYRKWLKDFLPDLFNPDFNLEPGIVKDRTDGHLVHLDGLNFSRATCLNGIAKALPELNHLHGLANKHLKYSLPNITSKDDYMGSHWLGTFALYALSKN